MNKKVLTLCAGFLLAGGMLSFLSAEQLSAVAGNGKYYKMEEGAYITNIASAPVKGSWVKDKNGTWFLDLDKTNGAVLSKDAFDYWKVEKVGEDTYELVNFAGEKLTVGGKTVFSIKENFKEGDAVEKDAVGFTQLLEGTSHWIGYAGNLPYVLEVQNLTNGYGIAWDAVDGTSGDVNYKMLDKSATDFIYDLKSGDIESIRFAYNNGSGNVRSYGYWDESAEEWKNVEAYDFSKTDVFKVSYDKKTETYSFTDVKTNKVLIAGNKVKSFVVKRNDHGAYLQDPTSSKYVKLTISASSVVDASLVDTEEEATYVGFQVTSVVGVPVKALNVLEKDGFSVTIYYDNECNTSICEDEDHFASDIVGNPFKGHLTTMVWDETKKVFLSTEDQKAVAIVEENPNNFYLKNTDGNYIVAQKYEGQGASEYQALYSFTTVKEADLKHYLIRKADDLSVDKEYFGLFRAEVKEADFEADPEAITKVDKLTSLSVYIGDYNWANVGRYDFTTNKVPTLVASYGTSLYPVLISLGDREIVDWKEFLQDKFFTIEKVTKDAKDNGYLVPESNNKTRFEKTYSNVLEGQWALTAKIKNDKAVSYTFTNRENDNVTFSFDKAQALYYKSGAENTYKYLGEEYVIKAVNTDPSDGYKVLATDKELNQKWNIAFASSVFDGKAYLTENHNDANDAEYHVIGLTTDAENALEFSVKKYDGKYEKTENTDVHKYVYTPADTIYVISELGYYNTKKKAYDTKLDTLKVLAYSFVNQWNEPLAYGEVNANGDLGYRSLVKFELNEDGKKVTYEASKTDLTKSHAAAQKFAIRLDGNNGNYNLRPVDKTYSAYTEGEKPADWKAYQIFNNVKDLNKMYAGDASIGILDNTDLYDRTENDLFAIEGVDSDIYRRLANNVDTVSIYRNYNEKSLLYEKTTEIADDVFVNFLGMENIADFTKMAPAMIADTAYVRNETYKPQYMLIVDPTIHPAGKWCEEHQSSTCEHAVDVPAWTEGRILVNLVDSAKAWDEANKHQVGNPYKNTEGYYKLGFVQATHRNDSLIVNGKRQFIGNNDNHIAKFQFRYADTEDKSFVIETSLDGTQTPGYLKWMNGVVVVVDDIKNADIYNMNEDEHRNPTANEAIAAGNVVVAGTNGAVVVKGAEGKNVIVSTILGKVVANEVVSSDNAQIATPAGIVVVSVDGESFKVVVK